MDQKSDKFGTNTNFWRWFGNCCKSTVMCLMITKWEQLGWTKSNERGYWCACMVAAACSARETRAVNTQSQLLTELFLTGVRKLPHY